MTKFRMPFYVSAALLAFAAGLAPQAFAAGDIESAYESVKDYTIEKKKDFVSWYDKQMSALETKYEKIKGDVKQSEAWQEAKQEADEKRAAAKRELKELREASAENWEEAKEEASEALEDLEEAYNKALEAAKTE